MAEIEFVVAVAKDGVIGRNGAMPWHIPSELKRFKQLTMGKPVIMGRKTWQSLPRRPLVGRLNIVVTRQANYQAEGAIVVTSKQAALQAAGDAPQVSVIGGGEVYRMFRDDVVRVYMTVVEASVDGDTYFPPLPPDQWSDEVIERVPAESSPGAPAYAVHRLERLEKVNPAASR